MTRLLALAIGLHCLAGLLAVTIARKRRQHRPVAFFLFGTAITDAIHIVLGRLVLWPALDSVRAAGLDPVIVPFTGWVRITIHLDEALFLTWYAGMAALALVLFARLRPWPVAVIWAAASLALALTYPITRGDVLRRVYLAADLAALAVAVASFAAWFRRRRPRQGFTLPQLIASTIFAYRGGRALLWRLAMEHLRELVPLPGRLRDPLRRLYRTTRSCPMDHTLIFAVSAGLFGLMLLAALVLRKGWRLLASLEALRAELVGRSPVPAMEAGVTQRAPTSRATRPAGADREDETLFSEHGEERSFPDEHHRTAGDTVVSVRAFDAKDNPLPPRTVSLSTLLEAVGVAKGDSDPALAVIVHVRSELIALATLARQVRPGNCEDVELSELGEALGGICARLDVASELIDPVAQYVRQSREEEGGGAEPPLSEDGDDSDAQ